MSFRISALDQAQFKPLFSMTEDELADNLAARFIADKQPGFPCRISLTDAEIGDELILVNYTHQEALSPYRSAHAVFVRTRAEQARPAIGEVPNAFRSRMLSLRAFNAKGMIVAADLVNGQQLEAGIERLLCEPTALYLHIHYAKFGCYAARADRA